MNSESTNNTAQLQPINREQFWQQHINQWSTSGLSKAAYSEQYALTYHQMVYWSAKLAPVVETDSTSSFVAVSVSSDLRTAGLSIRLPNGIIIEGFNDHRVDVIAKLIAQL